MNKNEILTSLGYSATAYKTIQPYSKHTYTLTIDAPDCDVQYCLRREDDVLSIAFRGTDTPQNWVSDFAFCKKSIPYDNSSSKIRVHAGFLDAYKSAGVREKILKSITPDIHYVRVTGHSMGAALSVLCAVDIQYNYPGRDIETILFGCPRVGNPAFQRSYNKRVHKTIRIENGNDIVTKVPLAVMGFRHVGAKLHIGSPRMPAVVSAKDHYPHQYYSSLYQRLMP